MMPSALASTRSSSGERVPGLGRPLRVIADDLTGAADSGAPFARPGEPVRLWCEGAHQAWAAGELSTAVVDSDTRGSGPAEAAAAVAGLVAGIDPGHGVFKKVDSLLRGNVGPELGVIAAQRPDSPLIVAPAFPQMGRETLGGVQVVRGVPLHHGADGWEAESVPPPPSIRALLEDHLPTVEVGLAAVRSSSLMRTLEQSASGGTAVVCDASTDDDLEALVRAAAALEPGPIWVGSGGLARVIARLRHDELGTEPGDASAALRPSLARKDRPLSCLVVVGSLAPVARAQTRALARTLDARHMQISSSALLLGGRMLDPLAADLAAEVREADLSVVAIGGAREPASAGRVAAALGRAVAAAARCVDALVLVGGATAAGVLAACSWSYLDLLAEPEPGIALARPGGDTGPFLVTKAGAFGDEEILSRVVAGLRRGWEPR